MKYQPISMDQPSVAAWMLCALLFVTTLGVNAQQTVTPIAEYVDGELFTGEQDTEYAASSTLETTVKLREGEHSLLEVLSSIADQAGLKLSYSEQIIPVDKKVRITQTTLTAKQALWHVLQGTSYRFGVSSAGQLVLLQTPPPPLQAQPETVTGTVSDASSGETLPGVNILVKGTSTGASTDADGNFELTPPSLQDTLVVSFVGYQTRQVSINGRTTINIALQSQTISGEEMVVVGYGEQEKENLTGSVSSVSGDELEERHVSTVSQALHGLSPGLSFSVGDRGFEPGASQEIDIRGITSLNGGSPLVIIDGFPGNMDNVNPDGIESISILKDAAASAIYGARGSNGVILITTKSGHKNEDLTVNYSGSMSVRSAARLPEQPDSYTFARAINEMGDNGGNRPFAKLNIDRIIAYQNGDIDFLKNNLPGGGAYPEGTEYYQSSLRNNGLQWGTNTGGNANYNWYDEFYGHSVNQKHNLSVSGGSDNSSYYINGGYRNQKGVLNYGTDTWAQYNLTGKLNTSVTDWWDVRYEGRFTKSPREHFNGKTNQTYSGVYRELVRTFPNEAKYTGFGTYGQESKIPWMEYAGTDEYTTTTNWQILETKITPLKRWNITANFAYKSDVLERTNRELTWMQEYTDGSIHPYPETQPNSVEQIRNNTNYWSGNLYTSYKLQIGEHHNLFGLLGSQLEFNESENLATKKINLVSQSVPSLSTATGNPTSDEDLTHWSTEGYYGRFRYNFNQKYLFEANARVDGTSRFKEGNRWGVFPSLSAGWNIDKEKFWQPVQKYVNSFKIRASWGQLGNQLITPYQDLALVPLQSQKLDWIYNYGSSRPLGYTGTPSLVSPDLTWETTTTKNLGFELGFLNNKLQVDLDIYEKVTDNMIGPSNPVPGVLGSDSPSSNNAKLRTRGWEASLQWNDNLSGSDFSYFINLNLSDHKTVVTDYTNPSGLISGYYPGKTVGEIWGYTANDLFKTQEEANSYVNNVDMSYIYSEWNAGDVKYEDTNQDGAVNPGSSSLQDHGDLSVIGNTTPRYQFGLNLGINYKAFDFSFLLIGTLKKDFLPNPNDYVYWGLSRMYFVAFTNEHLDYFRDQPGDKYSGLHEGDANINRDAYWPKPYLNRRDNYKNREPSTRYVRDGSYMRLKNLRLGYTVSDVLGSGTELKRLRIYLSAENLFTTTNLIKGIDPVALRGNYGAGMTNSADRIISLGVDISF